MATTQEYNTDHLVINHPDGNTERIPIPDTIGTVLKIGRELDNDVVLTDPRASRYHAELRRAENGIQIRDLGSSNGVVLASGRIDTETWVSLRPSQNATLAETRLNWESAASAHSTVAMKASPPIGQANTVATPRQPQAAAAPPPQQRSSTLPWIIGGAVIVIILLLLGIIMLLSGDDSTPTDVAGVTDEPAPTAAEGTSEPSSGEQGSVGLQTPSGGPTTTPTPSGPQLAIPVLQLTTTDVRPIFLSALPRTDKALLVINVRVENVGNAPFVLSTDDFSVRTAEGTILTEAGGTTSPDGLRRLGVLDRFNDLNLTAGGSVPESLIFEVDPETYEGLELIFEPTELSPLVIGLGTVEAGRALAEALGTPLPTATATAAAVAQAVDATATPTPEPTPTATRPPLIPAPRVVSRSALVGTIAFPVYNGSSYDLYLGDVASNETRFYRGQASQPDFNADGSRIAIHSWSGESRGLVTMDVSQANATLIANFVEDQLPTWTNDSQEIIFLSRRSSGRQSELYRSSATTELGDATFVSEGEYPSIGATGQMVFKGWGQTAFGLRVTPVDALDLQTVTAVDEDTAPAISPDGSQVAFMSRRSGNWDIYVINTDGTGLQQITEDEADDGLPTWSPDGNAIAFVSTRGGPWAIWATTPDGGGKRQLFTMAGSPDGQVGTDDFASRGWAEERISWTEAVIE